MRERADWFSNVLVGTFAGKTAWSNRWPHCHSNQAEAWETSTALPRHWWEIPGRNLSIQWVDFFLMWFSCAFSCTFPPSHFWWCFSNLVHICVRVCVCVCDMKVEEKGPVVFLSFLCVKMQVLLARQCVYIFIYWFWSFKFSVWLHNAALSLNWQCSAANTKRKGPGISCMLSVFYVNQYIDKNAELFVLFRSSVWLNSTTQDCCRCSEYDLLNRH